MQEAWMMALVHLTRFDPFESILFAAGRRWKTVGRDDGLFVTMTKPILTVIPLPHPPVEAGMQPGVRAPREAVLDGIVVNVVQRGVVVPVGADRTIGVTIPRFPSSRTVFLVP